MLRATFLLLFVLAFLGGGVAYSQQRPIDSTSFFPLGLWGIWPDSYTDPVVWEAACRNCSGKTSSIISQTSEQIISCTIFLTTLKRRYWRVSPRSHIRWIFIALRWMRILFQTTGIASKCGVPTMQFNRWIQPMHRGAPGVTPCAEG